MVQIDVPVAFGVSCFFADMASRQLRTGRPEYYFHTFTCTTIFQAFCFSWIPLYFLMNYFGWETTHMWWHEAGVTAYPLYIPIFVVVYWLAAMLGFLAGTKLVQAGRLWANRAVYIGILVFCAIWIFGQPGRSMRLGSYADWKAGTAPWFYEDLTFVIALAVTLVVWAAGLVYFGTLLRRRGTHLDTTPAETSE